MNPLFRRGIQALCGLFLLLLALPAAAIPPGAPAPLSASAISQAGGVITNNGKVILSNVRLAMPSRPLVQAVMATPPTVTAGTTSSMTSPFYVPANASNSSYPNSSTVSDIFTYSRGAPNTSGAVGITFSNVTTNAAGTTFNSPSVGISFYHYGSSFELVVPQTGNPYMIKIDDQYVTLTPQAVPTASNQLYYIKYDFGGVVKRRRIDFIGYNVGLAGVNINATDHITRAPIRGPRCIIIGDSYTGGSGASGSGSNNFVATFADAMGWDDVWASGVPGTGYVNTNNGVAMTFQQRLAHDVFPYNPEVIIVVGSVNDDGYTSSQVGSAATSLYAALRTQFPNALIAAAPTAKGGPQKWTATKLAIKDAMKAAATQYGVVWLDLMEGPITWNTTQATSTVYTGASASATTLQVLGTAAKAGYPQPGWTIEVGSGTTRERLEVKTAAFAGSYNSGANYYFNVTFDGALQYAHASGETWKQVGSALWSGHGCVGATTGWGNSDTLVSSDCVHPTDAGHYSLGTMLADLLIQATAPN
jgi:hypothetical protein